MVTSVQYCLIRIRVLIGYNLDIENAFQVWRMLASGLHSSAISLIHFAILYIVVHAHDAEDFSCIWQFLFHICGIFQVSLIKVSA